MSANKIRTLLVDDNPEFLAFAARYLAADERISVEATALSGEQAIDITNNIKPDLVLVDLAMPGMNGLEVTHALKNRSDSPRVIILTMYDNQQYMDAAGRVGADGFVTKAELDAKLLDMIHELFPEKKIMKNILIVDDSVTMRRMIKAALSLMPGSVISEAGNGLEAIEKMALKPFDLITLDLNMPDMHGMELLKFIRKHKNYTKTPIIIISTKGDEETREEANVAGVTLYITKPFDPYALAKHARELLEVTS